MIPIPTPEQSQRVLEILGEWTRRGWTYLVDSYGHDTQVTIYYPDPAAQGEDASDLSSTGINHFDAICQATTAMQALLELHPEESV